MATVLSFLIVAVLVAIVIIAFLAIAVALVRIAAALLLAIAGGGIIAAIASVWLEDTWPVVFIATSILLAFPALGWMFREKGERRKPASMEALSILQEQIEPAGNAELTAAWERAGVLAPEFAARLLAARQSCARLLKRSEATSLDMEMIEGAQMIRRHVPEVVLQNGEAIADSSGSELRAARVALVEDLEKIALMADNRLERLREANKDKLATLRAHLSSRSTE